ncbi:MAG: O-antigen ligase C-terminal domain-containing protein [Burkholderiales bacterium]|nr:O-antigen ligase C-terminal domain-containing protein [Burkholderiales bacterium]
MLPRIAARISLVLVGLMFLLPALNPYHFFPLTSFYTEWLALAFGLAALAPLSAKGNWNEVEIPTPALWLLGFAALLLLQLIVLDIAYPEMSLLGALYVIWAALLIWLGRVLAKSWGMEPLAQWLAAMLVLGGLLNAGAAVLQFYGFDCLGPLVASLGTTRGGAYGNFGQNNHFADYLALALVSVLYLNIKGQLHWPASAACSGILLYALSLSGSRASWLYLLAALALSLWFRARSADPRLRRAALAIAVLLPLFALVQYAMSHYGLTLRPALPGVVYEPVTPIDRLAKELAHGLLPQSGESALGIRIYMWHQALLMWSRAPLLGVGFGQYAGVFFEQAAELSRYHISHYDRNAHNALMQLLAETGLLGAGLVCAGLVAWLWGLRRHTVLTAEYWWMLCLLSVLFVHSMLEYPLWYANFLGVAAILLGMGSVRGLRLQVSALTRYAFPVMIAAGVFALGNVLNAYRDLELLMYPRVLPKNRAEIVAHNEALLQLHRDTLLAPYVEMSYAGIIIADRANLQDKLALNRRVLRLLPLPGLAYKQVLLLGLNGEHDAALLQLDRAAAVFPERLKSFAAQVEKAATQEPEAFGGISSKAREKLKQVDR